jgi:phosphoadenosine phosphosulfate reductase
MSQSTTGLSSDATSSVSSISFLAPTTSAVEAKAITLYAQKSPDFDAKLQETIGLLQKAVAEYGPVVQASSLGAEDMVLTHIAQNNGVVIPVFVLETGRLHTETLDLLKKTQAQLGDLLTVYSPQAVDVEKYNQDHGIDAIYQSIALRKACCQIRKLEPLERALAGKKTWLTGLRREQSGARSVVPFIDESEVSSTGRVKINPLAAWSWGDIWHYIQAHQVNYNLLHDQFFPSIGCEPCTRAVTLGEDPRSGRWWWEDASLKECGLHAKTPS